MFSKGNYQGVEYAAALIVERPGVKKIMRSFAPSFIARIARDGEVGVMSRNNTP